MLIFNGQQTKLQAGDVIIFDTDNDMVRVQRDGQLLQKEGGDESSYWAMPSDGVQISIVAELIADVCGLGVQEMKEWDFPTYKIL